LRIQELIREIERYEKKILELKETHGTLSGAFDNIETATQARIAEATEVQNEA